MLTAWGEDPSEVWALRTGKGRFDVYLGVQYVGTLQLGSRQKMRRDGIIVRWDNSLILECNIDNVLSLLFSDRTRIREMSAEDSASRIRGPEK